MTSPLDDAIALAAEAHRGQVDKAGEPYILHPLRVMFRIREAGHPVEVQAAAVLHDVVEDTHITLEDVATLSPAVAALVEALTRRPGEDYEAFIRRAGADPDARAVKVADLEDNLGRIDQLAQVSPERAQRLKERYERALWNLTGPSEDRRRAEATQDTSLAMKPTVTMSPEVKPAYISEKDWEDWKFVMENRHLDPDDLDLKVAARAFRRAAEQKRTKTQESSVPPSA